MSSTSAGLDPVRGRVRSIGRAELVGMLAMAMAVGALGIDLMLPAFDAMRADLGLAPGSNAIAGTVTAYFLGLAAGTLVYGPLADRFGRRPTLLASYAVYAVGALASALAPSLTVLLITRLIWGLGAAGSRVVVMAVVRDAYEGEEMSRAISHLMAVFIVVPVFAPTVGAGIVAVASWRWVFGVCVVAVALMAAWTLRLPETLRSEHRIEAGPRQIARAAGIVASNRTTVAYTLAMSSLYAVFISYLGTAENLFSRTFDQAARFPLIFGGLAAVIGVAMLLNARIVRRVGSRRLSNVVLAAYLVMASVMVIVALITGGRPPLFAFLVGLAAMFGCHALLIPNMNSIALAPMAEVAGTASSLMGASQLGIGAVLAALLDRAYDGTVTPLSLGFLGYGVLASALVLWARGAARDAPLSPDPALQ
ncbi:multidrug effflux MFS transporter [Gaopeijia maritima]|uniref:multidrug effflux MFS transporter n=1 Tax=Gaopeijia maritima TaxID=3119007 RepID=UPI00324F5C36